MKIEITYLDDAGDSKFYKVYADDIYSEGIDGRMGYRDIRGDVFGVAFDEELDAYSAILNEDGVRFGTDFTIANYELVEALRAKANESIKQQ